MIIPLTPFYLKTGIPLQTGTDSEKTNLDTQKF